MRLILALILFLNTSLLFAQQVNSDTTISNELFLKTFINKLADENIAVDIILSQDIIVEEPSDELYDY